MKNKAIILGILVLVVALVMAVNRVLFQSQNELKQVRSPDGHSVAILSHKERHGFLLSLEPPKTFGRWARLKLIRNGKTIYDSRYENLNIYQMQPDHALDVMWSPDSTRLAYRHITSLRIIGPDGKVTKHSILPEDSVISSFRWIDNESLLVVSKEGQYPLEMYGKPYQYRGYIDKVRNIRITRLHVIKGPTERYVQDFGPDASGLASTNGPAGHYPQAPEGPTFLFHSIDFCPEEISPNADQVAFSDGVNLCVYDDVAGKVIARFKIPQKPTKPVFSRDAEMVESIKRVEEQMAARPDELDGIWWQTNDKLVVGLELLGRQEKRAFFTFDVPSQKLTDQTQVLLPVWRDYDQKSHKQGDIYYFGWRDSDWFRSVIK
jgi:hypothetical protein